MEIIVPPAGEPDRIALLPGAFNPPTLAHLALAQAASELTDACLFVLPRSFPHKQYTGATLAQRLEMLAAVAEREPTWGVALGDGGLVIEIADELRQLYPASDVFVICGEDAAHRYLTWDYGDRLTVPEMLSRMTLLVASRGGGVELPDEYAYGCLRLGMEDWSHCSSSVVREAIREGGELAGLVPKELEELIRKIYR